MELRKIIRTDIAASAIAHLTLVALIIVISEVHPFHAAPPETVTVDIVTPEQVKEEIKEQETKEAAKEKLPEPPQDLKLPKLDFTDKSEAAGKPAAKQQAAAPSPQQTPAEPQQKQPQPSSAPKQREANVQPQPEQPQSSQQPPPQPQQQPPAEPMQQPSLFW